MKDYYAVLGLGSRATKEEIKSAFRKLAKKFHPDINKGDKAAEERFKEISEAYEVLGNEENRKKYDNARSFGSGFNFNGFSKNGPFGNFYDEFKGRTNYSNHDGSDDIFSDFIKIFKGTPFEGFGGMGDFGEVLGKAFNKAKTFASSVGNSFSSHNTFSNEKKTDGTVKVPLNVALNGGNVEVSLMPGGRRSIVIPPDTANNVLLHVDDWVLKVEVEDGQHFKVIGNNLKAIITINLAQAVLGSKVRFADPRGNQLVLVVPKETKQGDKVKISGLGLSGGDLIVEFDINMPHNLTEEQRNAFAEAAKKIGWKF